MATLFEKKQKSRILSKRPDHVEEGRDHWFSMADLVCYLDFVEEAHAQTNCSPEALIRAEANFRLKICQEIANTNNNYESFICTNMFDRSLPALDAA